MCDLLSLQDKSSTDEESKHSQSPILIKEFKKEHSSDEDSKGSDDIDSTQKPKETDEGDYESQNAIKLPGK